LLPEFHAEVVFDVGANVGQSAVEFRAAWPEATIYAFEPVPHTFDQLSSCLPGDERLKRFNSALGDAEGIVMMDAEGHSVRNRIVDGGNERVSVVRGDDFCVSCGVDRINYLKIDTEGHDLAVCRGFVSMLRRRRIDLVQVEAGLNPANKLHVPLRVLCDELEGLGYSIFRLYDQAGFPAARRCNPVFISPELVAANVRPTKKRNAGIGWL